MKPTLLVLAAGMGSRYGGLKQMDGLGPHEETIIDYSIHDAVEAGFGKVVYIVREYFKDQMEAAVKEKYAGVKTVDGEPLEFVFVTQELDRIPARFTLNPERQKPWGTAHAVQMAAEVIHEPFLVINGDDFYGRTAFEAMAAFLKTNADAHRHAMVGYKVENTLTENGSVSRGVCVLDGSMLTGVTERTSIVKRPGGAAFTEDGGETYTFIPEGTIVSMNFWGFMPSVVEKMQSYFRDFLVKLPEAANPLKAEYYLPSIPGRMLVEGTGKVEVLPTQEKWYGMTYKEDLPGVKAAIAAMKAAGTYPDVLWR